MCHTLSAPVDSHQAWRRGLSGGGDMDNNVVATRDVCATRPI